MTVQRGSLLALLCSGVASVKALSLTGLSVCLPDLGQRCSHFYCYSRWPPARDCGQDHLQWPRGGWRTQLWGLLVHHGWLGRERVVWEETAVFVQKSEERLFTWVREKVSSEVPFTSMSANAKFKPPFCILRKGKLYCTASVFYLFFLLSLVITDNWLPSSGIEGSG